MFNRRLTILIILWTLPALAAALRLWQLQILHAEDYRVLVGQLLERPPKYYPCLRGDITDRNGKVLAQDVPSWNICVHYSAIAKDVPDEGAADATRPTTASLDACWQAIADFTGKPVDVLLAQAARIKSQVARVKANHAARKGYDEPIEEEVAAHPIVRGLSQQQQVEANLRLSAFPAIRIQAGHVRAYMGGEPVGHLLGQVIEVDTDAIQSDPMAEDELARYRPGDLYGVAGAEAIGESVLRGWRGRIHEDSSGNLLDDSVDPVNGRTFRLSIDYALQEAFYARLGRAVEETEYKTGGCAVLLDIPTRQVLAMVDYPSMDPAAPPAKRIELYKDLARRPWLFRAVREYYPPGSTVKPMLLAAAMTEGLVSPTTEFNCYGRLFVDYPDRWRCTGTHAQIGPIAAIQRSCNVYFFHVGERLGLARELEWLDRFGFGRRTGVGLPGELPGRLPQASGDEARGAARNIGVGQGNFDVTPLQVANMVATLATGEYRPVTLKADDTESGPAERLPVSNAVWRLVREGMYKVANEPGGTAFGDARATLSDSRYVILGKTGSAEVKIGRTVETLFVCHLPDGRVQEITAPDLDEALARTDCPPADRSRIKVAGRRSVKRYPPDPSEPYTQAWFVGYLAPRNAYLSPVGADPASVAIAVVIEYTGHGGEVASPVAREMLDMYLQRMRDQVASLPAGAMP